ncbi:MAG TPA: hydantoinase/oxoprolinase family protein [Thermoanaerobaculia bacterium]|nr:hydantoinase/oxoprolinase family protein [Thermoanaerobaculia bacterium]
MTAWQVWIDTGGTFTDCLAQRSGGAPRRAKVLSSSALRVQVVAPLAAAAVRLEELPLASGALTGWRLRRLAGEGTAESLPLARWDAGERRLELGAPPATALAAGEVVELASPEEAPVLAARLATATPPDAPLPPLNLRLATTLGTNALLERRGAPVALFVTRGFADLLLIGTQQRPELFTLRIERPPPLFAEVVEVDERLAADGSVLLPIDVERLAAPAAALLARGVTSAAVALLHSFRAEDHERRLAQALSAWGFAHVSASAALAAEQGYLPRTETAVVDAYLAPVLEGYLGRIAAALGEEGRRRLLVMTSAGGLVPRRAFRAKDGLLSGPAGGVVGAAAAGRRSGFERLLTFDMGGTSTDVARVDGDFGYVFEQRIGAARLLAPALAIETVAAGGGSICCFDGSQLRVGPESGGADPGPACYGAGGPLCLTDVNLLLGRLDPRRVQIPLDPAAAEAALTAVQEAIRSRGAPLPAREALLDGFLRIADERMAEAIRQVSVRQGYDPADYALLAFGGAGPQHACSLAELLGIAAVVVPRDAGLLSAAGLGAARLERFAVRQVLRPLAEVEASVAGWLQELAAEARRQVAADGGGEAEVRRTLLELRFAGQETALEVEPESGESLEGAFRRRYRELYGYLPEARPLELVALRVVASARAAGVQREEPAAAYRPRPAGQRRAWLGGEWVAARCFEREDLLPGATFDGPALVAEAHAATVIEPGWRASVDGAGALVLRASRGAG